MSECNLCGGTRFLPMKQRQNVRCARCGSLERTRLLWLYIERSGILGPGATVLHFAPESGLSRRLRESVGAANYRAVDYDPSLYPQVPGVETFDLTHDVETLASESLDLIVHSHVLEHIPCNIAYPMFHLHRALKAGGLHACVIPLSPGRWDESFDPGLSSHERTRRFGQADHMRRIGREDVDQTLGKILRIARYRDFDATRDFSVETLHRFNIPESHWRGLTMGTPLLLAKSDYLLI
jgi:phosphoglycolate phosphatase